MAKVVILVGGPKHGEHIIIKNDFEYRYTLKKQIDLGDSLEYGPMTTTGEYLFTADCKDTDSAKEVFVWNGWKVLR